MTEAAPDNPEAWRLLGVAKTGSQDLKDARRAYEKAVRYAPDNIDGHRGLGVVLGGLKDPKAQGELDAPAE